jgi:hypothetical protein
MKIMYNDYDKEVFGINKLIRFLMKIQTTKSLVASLGIAKPVLT